MKILSKRGYSPVIWYTEVVDRCLRYCYHIIKESRTHCFLVFNLQKLFYLHNKVSRPSNSRLEFYSLTCTKKTSDVVSQEGTEKCRRPPKTIRNYKEPNVDIENLETESVLDRERSTRTQRHRGEKNTSVVSII